MISSNFYNRFRIYQSSFQTELKIKKNEKNKNYFIRITILCFSAIGAFAQTSNIIKKDLSQAEIDRIVQNLTAERKRISFEAL